MAALVRCPFFRRRGRDGCWTGGGWLGSGGCGRGRRPAAADGPADGGAGVGGDDAADEQQPGDHVEDVVGDVVEDQGAADPAEQEHGGDHAAQGPLAAEDRDPAEQDGGDHGQLQAGPVVSPGAGETQGEDDAAQPGHGAAEDVEEELDPPDADAGEERRLLVGADGEHRAAERGGVEDDPEHHGQDGEQGDRVGDGGAGDGRGPVPGVAGREVGHRLVAEDDEGQAAVQGQGADGHGQRGQAEPGHQEAVEGAGQGAGHEHGREDQLQGPAGVPQPAQQGAGQAEDGGDRQVDLAGDDDHGQRQGQQGDLAHVQAQVEQVGAGEEPGRGLLPDQADDDQEHDQRGLPAQQPPDQGTAVLAGRGGRGGVSRHFGRSSGAG